MVRPLTFRHNTRYLSLFHPLQYFFAASSETGMIGYPINKELVPTIARVSEGTWPRLCKKITFSDLFDEKRVLYFENTQESYGIRAPGAFLEWGLTSHQPVSQRISTFFHGLQRGAYSYFTVIGAFSSFSIKRRAMSRPQEKIPPGGDAVITGAHRVSTIMHVHQILVTNDGEIVERGIHGTAAPNPSGAGYLS